MDAAIISANKMGVFIHQDDFCNRVLNWVLKMQAGPARFRINEGADSTIFTSCFALFIFDLFGEVSAWPQNRRDLWIGYINSFQDRESGYFILDNYKGNLNTKTVQQLTCFCLSALDILGSSPEYRFSFLKQWPRPEDIFNYLREIGCFSGKPTTGNMAMFLAIFLTYQYEKYKDESALTHLNSWFYWHEKTQNESTGFWGNPLGNRYYLGFQNAFHQYVIYNYWSRAVPYHKKIVDIVLSLQDKDGYFAPIPGGGGCWDYDAADILINCGYKRGYKREEISDALTRLYFAILKNQNEDGGFCESRRRPSSTKNAFGPDNLRFVFSGRNPYLWYYRLGSTMSISKSKRERIFTHWTREGRLWNQSDLWDTWIRCLTLAEINKSLNLNDSLSKIEWKFHNIIGLGYYNNEGTLLTSNAISR